MPSCASTASAAAEPEATRKDGLMARFGADIVLPDLFVAVASCDPPGGASLAHAAHGSGTWPVQRRSRVTMLRPMLSFKTRRPLTRVRRDRLPRLPFSSSRKS
jgi:hypothetical protein